MDLLKIKKEGGEQGNVSKLSVSERYARETGREAIGNGLRIFPVSRSRIPKIPDFC